MKVALFCSSRSDIDRQWIDDAATLGQFIGSRGWTLVYGGVKSGLMQVAAEATRRAGGRTVGVVPVKRRTMEDDDNDVNIAVKGLQQRKEAMMCIADIFVALPGGYGTLDEVISTMSSLAFNDDRRRVVVLNAEGLFDPIRMQFYRMIEHGLMQPSAMSSLSFVSTIDAVIKTLQSENEKK